MGALYGDQYAGAEGGLRGAEVFEDGVQGSMRRRMAEAAWHRAARDADDATRAAAAWVAAPAPLGLDGTADPRSHLVAFRRDLLQLEGASQVAAGESVVKC